MLERITSERNPEVRLARSLHRRKGRQEEGGYLAEGVRLIAEAIAAGQRVRLLFVCPEFLDIAQRIVVDGWAKGAERAVEVPSGILRLIADTDTPQGVIAVLDLPDTPLPTLDPATALVLVLDSVRDPGNVGTLIRTAAAAGATAVVTTFGTADAYAPKVVRAAMGAHFRLPVVYDVAWEWLGPALAALPATYVTDGDATLPYDAVNWTRGAAVIVGNEDHGVSPDALPWVVGNIVIPMAHGVESLNAAMSGAVVLFEAARQRRARN